MSDIILRVSYEFNNLGPEWQDNAVGKRLHQIVDQEGVPAATYSGHLVRLNDKKTHTFTQAEKAGRVFLA